MPWPQTNPTHTWSENTKTWMTELDDSISIQDLTIPGTHDSAAMKGCCYVIGFPSGQSETQGLTIKQQLEAGVRFLDMRVAFSGPHGLQMMHGSANIYDPDNKSNILMFTTVLKACLEFLEENPKECLVMSVKPEQSYDTYQDHTIEDWFRAHAKAVGDSFTTRQHWYDWWDVRSSVDATLHDLRGKILLWRRFPHMGLQPHTPRFPSEVGAKDLYALPFGLDLTPLNDKFDNTPGAGWLTGADGYCYVQDDYNNFSDLSEKANQWYMTFNRAYDTRWNPANLDNRQYLNFLSVGKAAHWPVTFAGQMNPLMTEWLAKMMSPNPAWGAPRRRSGMGAMPLDFADATLASALIQFNFSWTYQIAATSDGLDAWAVLRDKYCDGW